MVVGLLFAILAGALVGLQNIFNSKVNERAGTWSSTTLILGLGFLASFLFGILFEGKHLFDLQNMKTWHWFSGLLGVGVVTCIVNGMKLLGLTYTIAILMTSQLGVALLIDSFGWLGVTQVPFTFKQLMGVIFIVAGIAVFKFSGRGEKQTGRMAVKKKIEVIE